jgi:CRP-like cAMP-binding protein
MKPGDSFGEIALIDGKLRTASARATAPSDLMIIRRQHFTELMARDPQLPIHLLTLFCERLRWTSGLIEESAFLSVPARLAKHLLRLAHPPGTVAARGTALTISQGDLARFLSVSRQTVNHHLQEWHRQGWIDVARLRIVIRNAEALANVASDRS